VGVVLQLKAVEVEAVVVEEEVNSVKLEGKFYFLTAAVVFLYTFERKDLKYNCFFQKCGRKVVRWSPVKAGS
jgi:hypothetical protein